MQTDGAKLWNYTTGGVVFSSPAVVGGVVYIGSTDNNVYALNATDGAKLWNYTTEPNYPAEHVFIRLLLLPVGLFT